MLTDNQFLQFYAQTKSVLEKYSNKTEVKQFLLTTFTEVEKSKSLTELKQALVLLCKQLSAKPNTVGLTAFGGTCSSCGCLKKLRAISQEIASVLKPLNTPKMPAKRSKL